jgi:uncharacterized protein YfiM (DUF2279 family)
MSILVALLISLNSYSIEFDKAQHFAASALISEAASIHFKNNGYEMPRVNAIYLTIGIGIAKELHDPIFDKKDLLYDVLGAITPALLRWEF